MKKLLLAIVLIVGCDSLNINETETTHEHNDKHGCVDSCPAPTNWTSLRVSIVG